MKTTLRGKKGNDDFLLVDEFKNGVNQIIYSQRASIKQWLMKTMQICFYQNRYVNSDFKGLKMRQINQKLRKIDKPM